MKKTFLLLGIVAMALGNMTSCSNILEEEGTIPASAKTGTLTVALEADNGIDVSTKTDVVTVPSDLTSKMKVTATKTGESTEITSLQYKEISSSSYIYSSTLAPGSYSVTALYDETNNAVLIWDSPIFKGTTTSDVTVEKGKEAEATIEATLQNSQIVVDNSAYTEFCQLATVSELYVYNGTTVPTTEEGKYSLLNNNALETKTLYVAAGQSDVYINIKGQLSSGGQTFEVEKSICSGDEEKTEAAKKYTVKYSLSTENGSMKITININGYITVKEIKVDVNPYEEDNATNE
ncbi:MAG: DUF4493 domain-containing protein [Parabacteroides sp.]|nr:DUF4493 domain-containing protein [Parabacteroides sp.]